ncbi:hypothetical protein [Asticcacaulis solisilvae]|uniref:hypothetical protein n=1 Tax=Asticcacaulis solisilvae TaxID=1217274 RepID=UPI003FD827AD
MLGEDLTQQAVAKKQAAPALDDSGFALVARTLGIDPAPGPLDVMMKARLGALRSRVDAAVAAAEAAGGPLSSEQRMKVALDAGATTVDGHPLFKSPQVDAVLNVRPDTMKTPEPTPRLTKPYAHGGSHPGNTGYFPPTFWPGQPEQDRKIKFRPRVFPQVDSGQALSPGVGKCRSLEEGDGGRQVVFRNERLGWKPYLHHRFRTDRR